ncbi:XRE family transcriptional regulator [Mesorhizobium sp. M6A.T.Cr.TU.017.01.1.1]|uniref:helix-turn-helix domain-containing protein n=1 Tax=Mesorhizobium sp. M6A.T.Cr.TU.017.01.1.1 TaxID=2496774 RepID=UPI0013E2C798|nr:XRE family transcriptional regulator [Mesorhizobium sp. M6A.T.Cr.TU.017.01.1.1]
MNALVNKLTRFADKDYRDGYVQTQVRAGIAYQIQALRRKFGLSQSEMAARTEKKQSVISRLENTEYGKVTIQTLLDIASGLDVALLVQFVSYPDFLKRTADMSDKALQPETIQESLSQRQFLYGIRDQDFLEAKPAQSENRATIQPFPIPRNIENIPQIGIQ